MPCTLSSRKIYYGSRYKLVLQYRILTSFWSNMLSVFAPTPKSIIYKFYSLWFYPLLTYPFAKYFCSEITPKFLLCDHEKYCHVHRFYRKNKVRVVMYTFREHVCFRPPFIESSWKMCKYFSYDSSCGHILTTKRLIFVNRHSCYEDDFIAVFDFQWTWSGIQMYKLSCLKQISVCLVAFAIVTGVSIWYLEQLLFDTEVLTHQLYITERTKQRFDARCVLYLTKHDDFFTFIKHYLTYNSPEMNNLLQINQSSFIMLLGEVTNNNFIVVGLQTRDLSHH